MVLSVARPPRLPPLHCNAHPFSCLECCLPSLPRALAVQLPWSIKYLSRGSMHSVTGHCRSWAHLSIRALSRMGLAFCFTCCSVQLLQPHDLLPHSLKWLLFPRELPIELMCQSPSNVDLFHHTNFKKYHLLTSPPISSEKSLGNGNLQTRDGKYKFSKIPSSTWEFKGQFW